MCKVTKTRANLTLAQLASSTVCFIICNRIRLIPIEILFLGICVQYGLHCINRCDVQMQQKLSEDITQE